jgi:uncharacterized membrane protein (Fun14 family)
MSADIVSQLPMMSGWGVVGFAVGFVTKKMLKILLIFAGVYFATLLYLQQQGWITINEGLETSVDGLGTFVYQRATDLWTVTMVSLPVLGAFGVGAILGFKKG